MLKTSIDFDHQTLAGNLDSTQKKVARKQASRTSPVVLQQREPAALAVAPPAQRIERSDGLCRQLVHPYSYDCQEYMVTTEDSFLLGVQRIKSPKSPASRGPVFLYHGVLIGGDIWVLNPPSESLPYILADAGYDVWLGNTRTTSFSYGHVSYRRSDQGFWDWSVDELSRYDLSAMIKHTYAVTGRQIKFIGYSEGTQAAFAAFSQGQLVEYIEKAVMLAPIAYLHHFTSPIGLAGIAIQLDKIYDALHIYQFSLTYRSRTGKQLLDYLCPNNINFCQKNWITLLTGNNCCLNNSRWEFYDNYELQDTSAKNMKHFAQQYRTQTFCKFDYGATENFRRYRSKSPPSYDLTGIPSQLPLLLINGGRDALSDPTDVDRLIAELPSRPQHLFIPDYAHFDFVLGLNAKDKVYGRVLSFFAG
ncbi:triacylglycerol lipase 1 isoform X2 [Selaginella moellendorffii]|uniref:triacylglycerol lipase 1 isoform X2 n=1 Tax=Selaginella moellendorffii TaxID=88036 RepID=UPI000D1D081F|nr:triacylglycerol lipase 1 isoform X2 [Selaginella moellendorffii]|eukprot:XP_024538651.1 triacylglycerol lipase 1 isoform X2 [Selaginella moellendorffii]